MTTLKKIIALAFIGGLLTVAACTTKPKTEEAGTDPNAMMATSDSATVTPDSGSTMTADTAN